MRNIKLLIFLIGLLFYKAAYAQPKENINQPAWSVKAANVWYENQDWINGCNFIPSIAVNQLEMWQKDTFDLPTINKELSFAEDIGFNTVRVFLHSQAWRQDPSGFKLRINEFLSVANKHHIKTIFVFLTIVGTT